MSLYFIRMIFLSTDMIAAFYHQPTKKLTFKNDKQDFEQLITALNSRSKPNDIRTGFESTAHYALNLELFLENAHHSFMEINPVLIKEYKSPLLSDVSKPTMWTMNPSTLVNDCRVQTPFKRILPHLFLKVTSSTT